MRGFRFKTSLLFIQLLICLLSIGFTQQGNPNGFGGVGLQITLQNGQLYVVSVIPGSPAEKSGIRAGDTIYEIDHEPVSKMSLDTAISKIRGQEGTSVNFGLKRRDKEEDNDLNLTVNREFIVANIPSLSSTSISRETKPLVIEGMSNIQPTLYFIPLTAQVSAQTPFLLQIYFDNPRGILTDEAGFWIQYDPKALSPYKPVKGKILSMDTGTLSGWSIVTSYSDLSSGELYIQMKNLDSEKPLSGNLGKIEFIASGNRPVTQVQFRFNDWGKFPNTFFTNKQKDMLGKNTEPKDGTIGTTIRVIQEARTSP